MPTIEANGIDLYYEKHGTGTPIFIIHGTSSSALVWAWTELASWTLAEIAPNEPAILLRDRDDPSRFVSFGPWETDEQVAFWRESEGFATRVGAIRELLDRFEAHTLDPVAQTGSSLP